MNLGVYKSGQGYYTRMGTVVGVSLLTLLGLFWIAGYAKAWKIFDLNPIYTSAGVATLIGLVVFSIMYWFVFVYPKTVDFLVATEGEMKKVNWSTRREIIGSTATVIVTAAIITVFCWGIDHVFAVFFGSIKVLDAG